MISTKGRYALRVMLDLAEHGNEGYIPLKDIAKRQNISDKYLESILKSLVKQKMLKGLRGKGGGYQLTRTPAEYSVGEILEVAEGSLAPVACLMKDADACPRAGQCRTPAYVEKVWFYGTRLFLRHYSGRHSGKSGVYTRRISRELFIFVEL